MKRVLFIVSSFAPAMPADGHRARMLCRELPRLGWEVEVLSPGLSYQRRDVIDAAAAAFFPEEQVVHSVPAWYPQVFRTLGMASIGWRALWPMLRMGSELVRLGRYDVAYFSTTNFVLFCLGRIWRERHGLPYVLDFHDPWYRDSYRYVTTKSVWKWHAAHFLAKHLERYVVLGASGVVSVSKHYVEELTERYRREDCAWLAAERHRVMPFAATPTDFSALGSALGENRAGNQNGLVRLVYTGAGGAIMGKSFEVICRGLAALREREAELVRNVRILLQGTEANWRQGEETVLQSVARRQGVGDLVEERPQRISYTDSLRAISAADGLLLLGVDDAGYVPSKLFTYALSGKPLLACLHGRSPVRRHFQGDRALGRAVMFEDGGGSSTQETAGVLEAFLREAAQGAMTDRREYLAPYLAEAMAREHAVLFERCAADRKNGRSGSA